MVQNIDGFPKIRLAKASLPTNKHRFVIHCRATKACGCSLRELEVLRDPSFVILGEILICNVEFTGKKSRFFVTY